MGEVHLSGYYDRNLQFGLWTPSLGTNGVNTCIFVSLRWAQAFWIYIVHEHKEKKQKISVKLSGHNVYTELR